MLLIEADGKALFRQYGLTVPQGVLVTERGGFDAATPGPLIVKAQVPAGGRGKAGGVLRCPDAAAARAALDRLLGGTLLGHRVEACLVERPATGRECYLSVMLDAAAGAARLTFLAAGGVEVESQAAGLGPGATRPCDLDPAAMRAALQAVTAALPAPEAAAVRAAGEGLIRLFLERELLLAEVNPLFLGPAGGVAGDAKVVLDLNALHRQPALEAMLLARPAIYADACRKLLEGFDYVELDPEGRIGLITTGAGLSMMLVDELVARGARPLNFLDIRTGQLRGSPARLLRVLDWIAARPSVRVLFVNIFAGITDQREFAALLAEALAANPVRGVPVVARLVGNGAEEARAALAARRPDIALFEDLEAAMQRAVALAAA
jgi:succinyl-CoA synthetase beta subunit